MPGSLPNWRLGMEETPGLDRLTRDARETFLANVADPDFLLRMGGLEGLRLSAAALEFLRSGDTFRVDAAIRELHRVTSSYRSPRQEVFDDLAEKITAELPVASDVAVSLARFIRWMESTALSTLIAELLVAYTDADISVLLIELYHMHYDEFDPNELVNALDFNADDDLPTMCETPHNHLADLIVTAATARLMKNHGRDLLLAWFAD